MSQQLWEPSVLREQLVLWGRVAVWGLLVLPETLWWLVQLAAPVAPVESVEPGEPRQLGQRGLRELWERLMVRPAQLVQPILLEPAAQRGEPGAPGESKQSVQPELVPLPEAPGEPELLRPLEEWGELSDRTTQPGRHHCCQR